MRKYIEEETEVTSSIEVKVKEESKKEVLELIDGATSYIHSNDTDYDLSDAHNITEDDYDRLAEEISSQIIVEIKDTTSESANIQSLEYIMDDGSWYAFHFEFDAKKFLGQCWFYNEMSKKDIAEELEITVEELDEMMGW